MAVKDEHRIKITEIRFILNKIFVLVTLYTIVSAVHRAVDNGIMSYCGRYLHGLW